MSTPAIQAANDEIANAVERALTGHPVHLPFPVHQAARDAVAAYRAGDRNPEVMFCLLSMFASMNDNALRYRLMTAFQQIAYDMAQ